nr:MAG TPA: hypothetical protein [Crassvirales sp.]
MFSSHNFAQNKAVCLITNELDRLLYNHPIQAITEPYKPYFSLYSAI